MTYTVSNSDNSLIVNVEDTVVDTTYSLNLIGRNVSGYGQFVVENTIRHLENFASATAPSGTKLTGQLWYDKAEGVFKNWTGSAWKRSTNILVDDSAPTTSLAAGTAWLDTRTDILYIHDGSTFKAASYAGEVSNAYSGSVLNGAPNNYGTRLRNIFLTASDDSVKPCLALVHVSDGTVNQGATTSVYGKETVMAIFSDNPSFVIKNAVSSTEGESINWYAEFNAVGGIGTTINPGLNLRTEYDATAIALSTRATRADAAYKLNTGSFGADGSNIDASAVIHTSRSYVPTSGSTYDLGSTGFAFNQLVTNNIELGSGGAAALTANGTVTMGASGARISTIHVDDPTVYNVLAFNSANIASAGSRVDNSFFANVDATSMTIGDYTMPAADGTLNQALVTDGNGVISFQALSGDISDVTAGAGLTGGGSSGAVTLDVGAGNYIIANANDIDVDATTTNTASKVVARDASGNFAAGQITATQFNGPVTQFSLIATNTTDATHYPVFVDAATGNEEPRTDTGFTYNPNSETLTASTFSGTATEAQYADVAEIYSSDELYEPGTVVKLGGEAEVTKTTHELDTDVFGVISTNPALLMNKDAVGLPVALTGRVPVKVTGPVSKGERIVTSNIAGIGQALGNYPYDARTIIGRAIQDKTDSGLGLIEIVVGVR